MLRRIQAWIDERWPLSPLLNLTLDEEIAGGARYAYTLGSAVFIVFGLQALSGVMQLFFYTPATDHAYNSISYLRTSVPFGWLIHGLHFWGANLMIVLLLLHMTRVFLWGAYKRPRELTWLAGVALLMTAMAFSFTGGPLHWDQRGYWVGEVSTSIAGTAPVVGDTMKRFLRGGEEMGQLALSRMFGLHVAILPLSLAGLFGIHIIAMRHFGTVGPWQEEKRKEKGPFWPDQVFKDAVVGTGIFLLLLFLSVFFPPAYTGMADPLDTSYIPKPEWNFLFLYESLKYFEGRLEPVGTVGVPTVLILILVLLPFIDRNPERNPLKRPVVMLGALIIGGILIGLSIKGYLSPGFGQVSGKGETPSALSKPSEGKGLREVFFPRPSEATQTPRGAISSSSQTPAERGPSSSAPHEKGLPGQAAFIIGSAERGAELFKKNCSSCHGSEGKGGLPNPGSEEGKVPDLNPIDREIYRADARTFSENIDVYLQHGAVPAGPGPAIHMPAFGDTNTLTQQEISSVEAYILLLNGVDRGQLINPGIAPRRFFLMVVVLYGIVVLALGGVWRKRSSR